MTGSRAEPEFEEMLDVVLEHEDRLSQREAEFIDQINMEGEASDKQLEWLRSIYKRVQGDIP